MNCEKESENQSRLLEETHLNLTQLTLTESGLSGRLFLDCEKEPNQAKIITEQIVYKYMQTWLRLMSINAFHGHGADCKHGGHN